MAPRNLHSAVRRRLVVVTGAVLTIAAGLLVHSFGSGVAGDVAGDALYAVLIYLLFVFLLPRHARSLPAALAIMFCTAIELLQLTDIPATITSMFAPAALVLGAGFDQRDLLVYAFAVIGVLLVDVAISRSLRSRRSSK